MNALRAWARALLFAYTAAAAALSPSAYTARTRAVAMREVYFSAWQVLPGFTLVATLLSVGVIASTLAVARGYGIAQYGLELAFSVIVLEMVPLLTALYVALRSGAATATAVAMMRLSGELEAMRAGHVDPYEREFVPRIVAAAISVLTLTVVSVALVMISAYFVIYGASPWGFAEYTRAVALVFGPLEFALLAFKAVAFGVVVAVVPIAAGLEASRDVRSAPLAVSGGMVRLFVALALIELVALAVKYG